MCYLFHMWTVYLQNNHKRDQFHNFSIFSFQVRVIVKILVKFSYITNALFLHKFYHIYVIAFYHNFPLTSLTLV